MTTVAPVVSSPNEALAAIVIAKLKDGGFIEDGKFDEILSKVQAGTATPQDWRLWLELAQSNKLKDGNDGKG